MRITIVQGAFLPVPPLMGGAVEKVWQALGEEFAHRGHDVVHISRVVSPLPQWEVAGGVTHVRVRGYDTPASLPLLKLLDLLYSFRARAALPKRSDIIVTNTFWLPMLLRSSSRGQVYVHVARFPKGQMRYYAHCARLQAPSRAVAEAVKQQAPELSNKVTAIPYPRPEPIDPSTPPPLPSRPATILYVGRVHPEKGVHLLVEAFTRLPLPLTVSWKLRIVGPWESHLGGGGEAYRDQLLRLAEGRRDSVQLHGPIFEACELEREFRTARVFVYPSLAETGETFGLAPLEAMTHGCATVVSNLGCFHDFVIDDETGFIFDHRVESPAVALELKLAALLNNEPRLAAVAARGRAQTEEYSLQPVAAKYVADFQLLTESASAAR